MVVFIDPHSEAGSAITARPDHDVATTPTAAPLANVVDLRVPNSWQEAVSLVEAVVGAVGCERVGGPERFHPAVRLVLRDLPDAISDGTHRVPLLAARAGLSPSRLSHLFTEQVGTPLRRYIVWSRLVEAAEQLSRGESLTAAAHSAGFADGAHLSRAFRAAFGLTASESVAHGRWLRPHRDAI